MAEQLAEHLWRLEIPLVGNPMKRLNSYLITGERNLLIDTGFRQEPCRAAMVRQLDGLGIDLNRTDLFLTHLHGDHTGLSTELHRPGCRIFISETDGRGLLQHEDENYWRKISRSYERDGFSCGEMEELWSTNPAKESLPEPFSDYTHLSDGDVLRYGGYRLRCMLTPGHTPGHLCLYDAERALLFSGDHILFRITPNICRWEEMPDALGSYLESLERVCALPVQTVLTGHRAETGNLSARVEELKRHHQHRVDEALAIVRTFPGLTAYEIAGRMTWSIHCRSWTEFPLVQKFFAVGEALSHLDYLEVRGRVRRELWEGKTHYCAVE